MEQTALGGVNDVQTVSGPGHTEKMDILIVTAVRSAELHEWVLGDLAKQLRKANISFAMSVVSFAWNNSAPTRPVCVKLYIWIFFLFYKFCR